MAKSNYERLIELADEVFDYRDDPDQIEMTPEQREKFMVIHPATMSAENTADGPVAWLLLLPTTYELMEEFVKGELSEKKLLELTPVGVKYDAIYLCSALVLEEYRRKGITESLALEAYKQISALHPIRALFVWPFSDAGDKSADHIAAKIGLPLFKRQGDH